MSMMMTMMLWVDHWSSFGWISFQIPPVIKVLAGIEPVLQG